MINQTELRQQLYVILTFMGMTRDKAAEEMNISKVTLIRFLKHQKNIVRFDALQKIYKFVHDNYPNVTQEFR